MPRSLLLLLLPLTLLAGCPSAEPEPEPEELLSESGLTTRVRYYAGSVLERASERPDDAHPHVAWSVRVSVLALDRIDPGVAPSLSEITRLVTTVSGPHPFRVAPQLLAGARGRWLPSSEELRGWLERDQAGQCQRVAMLRGVLVQEATAVFELEWAQRQERLGVWLHRREREGRDVLDVALSKQRGRGRVGPARAHELLLLDARDVSSDQAGLVAVLPCSGDPAAVAVLLEITPPPTSGPELAAHQRACELFRTRPSEQPEPVHHANGASQADVTGLLARVTRPGASLPDQRWALARLGRVRRARLCYELALAGDDALVSDLARRLSGAPDDDGWRLERAALDAVQGALPLEVGGEDVGVRALLLVYAGAAGYRPRELFACASEAGDLAELEQRLVQANRALLDDPASAVSERARAWLRAEGHDAQ